MLSVDQDAKLPQTDSSNAFLKEIVEKFTE